MIIQLQNLLKHQKVIFYDLLFSQIYKFKNLCLVFNLKLLIKLIILQNNKVKHTTTMNEKITNTITALGYRNPQIIPIFIHIYEEIRAHTFHCITVNFLLAATSATSNDP